MTELLVSLAGLLAIAAIVWWFWLSAPAAVRVAGSRAVEIRVADGAYQPAVIAVPAGRPLVLRFVRRDATPCAETVVFSGLGIQAELPLDRPFDVSLPALPAGTHEFTCQMGMYRGKVIAQ